MATKVYESGTIELVDGSEVYIQPLKIKYLREFMEAFNLVHLAKTDEQSINVLSHCAFIALRPQCPLVNTKEDFEDLCDLPTTYKILDIAAGIKIKDDSPDTVKKQAEDSKSNTWDSLELAELEAEVFLLGIWKDYEELELSLSMPELLATLEAKRTADYEEKKFLAAIQGVDIEKNSQKGQDEWEKMKARVFSGGKTEDSNDIVSFQGTKAAQNGFGIGMGLGYEDHTQKT